MKKIPTDEEFDKDDWSGDRFKGTVKKWQTNKIRKILDAYYTGSSGYPVRFWGYIGYFSGIAIWLAEDWVIDKYETAYIWDKYPHEKWRTVCVYHRIVEMNEVLGNFTARMNPENIVYPNITGADKQKFEYPEGKKPWFGYASERANVDYSILDSLLEWVPMLGSKLQELLQKRVHKITLTQIPIFENIGFFKTINTLLINANWDKIKNRLITLGWKVYDK